MGPRSGGGAALDLHDRHRQRRDDQEEGSRGGAVSHPQDQAGQRPGHDHPQGDYIYYRYIGYTVEMKRAGINKPLALLDWLHMEVTPK